MEINDVLTDPCPQCALKHLSAALFYALRPGKSKCESMLPFGDEVLAAIALINIAEFKSGYTSHFAYIVGALAAAEDLLGPRSPEYRSARLSFVNGKIDNAINILSIDAGSNVAMARAHVLEALRELPMLRSPEGLADCVVEALLDDGVPRDKFIDAAQDAIAWVRENFFYDAQPAQTGGDTNGQG